MYYNLAKTAELLGLNTGDVNRLREQGKLRAFKDGPDWKFRKEEVEQYLTKMIKERSAQNSDDGLLASEDDDDKTAFAVDSSAFDAMFDQAGDDLQVSANNDDLVVNDDNGNNDDLQLAPADDDDFKLVDDDDELKLAPEEAPEDALVKEGDSPLTSEDSALAEDLAAVDLTSASGSGSGDGLTLGSDSGLSLLDDVGGSNIDLAGDGDDLILGGSSGSGSGDGMSLGSDSGLSLMDDAEGGFELDAAVSEQGGLDLAPQKDDEDDSVFALAGENDASGPQILNLDQNADSEAPTELAAEESVFELSSQTTDAPQSSESMSSSVFMTEDAPSETANPFLTDDSSEGESDIFALAGEPDAPATSAEIDSAIDRLLKLDRQKKESEQKSRDGATFDANGLSVAFSDPVSSFDESNRPDVAFDAEVPKRADEKISEVAGLSSEQSDLGDFPSNARDAFARSEAAANALAANSSFKLDESFRQKPEKSADSVESVLTRSETATNSLASNASFKLDESFRQKPENTTDPVENALARSETAANVPASNASFKLDESFRQKPEKSVDPVEAALADADRNRSKNADAESDVAQTRVMFNGREPLPEPADEQPASKPTPSVASKPESTPRVVANEQTPSSPYDEPLPDPRDSLLAADPVPSRSTALESSPAEEIADTPFPDPFDSPLTDPQDSLLAADPTPSQSSALESSPAEEIADAPFPDPFDSPLTDPQDSLLAADPAPSQSSALESAPAETPVTAPSARSDSQRVAHDAPSDAATSSYAVDQLPTPNSDVVRSVTFSNRERVETFNREEDEFETALDSLRRRGADGAEIICVVNWSNGSGVRDAEVVRLPKHAGPTNNAASGAVKSHYAADQLPTPNSDLTRSTPSASREEDEFETALDSLRRRGMNGAEIVCIVNWPDGSGVRETEVVRLPKRAVRTNPAAPGAGVELARKPETSGVAGQADAPLTSSRPDARVYK